MRSAGFARDAAAYEEGAVRCPVPCIPCMAKLTRSDSVVSALVEGVPTFFTAGTGRFSIGITNREGKVTYHLHLSEVEAQRFTAFVVERTKAGA